MKKQLLLLLASFCLCGAIHAQVHPDGWNFTCTMYPNADSMRYESVGFSVGNSGYIGTGRIPNTTNFYRDFYKIRYDAFFQLDVVSAIDSFPIPTAGAVGFGIGGYGYVLTAHVNPFGVVTDQKLYSFDTLNNDWSAGVQFPGGVRTGMSAFAVNGKGYIVCGSGTTGFMTEVWEYNPVTGNWTQKNNFPGPPRAMGASFAIGNKGYYGTGAGVVSGTTVNYADLWEYEPTTDSWTQKASMPQPGRFAASGFSAGGRGYITQGSAGVVPGDTWEYDPTTDAWTMKEQFPGGSRSYMASFSAAGRGYAGNGIGGLHNTVWAFSPADLSIGNLPLFEYCKGDTIQVPYYSHNTVYQSGNEFIVEMDNGNFSTALQIGTLSSTAASGTVTCVIPQSALTGISLYRMRIRSTNPAYVGGKNALNLGTHPSPGTPVVTQTGNVLTSSAGPGYQWYDATGAIAGATNQSYTVTATGSYYVRFTGACTGPKSNAVTITISGVSNISLEQLTLNPNPATEVLNISIPGVHSAIEKLVVMNMQGQVVLTNTEAAIEKGQISLPVKKLATGQYLLFISSSGQTVRRLFSKL